jgi:isoquinoline 1-oxidoreductase beta subunit
MAKQMKRPVQLVWSRLEETIQDSFRPPARRDERAARAAGGSLGWQARIAAPRRCAQVIGGCARASGAARRRRARRSTGAVPPYAIPRRGRSCAADVGLAPASGARARTATPPFSPKASSTSWRARRIEPLSFRMQMLGDNPRLARVLTTAATLGGWDGGAPGSAMGIAAHSASAPCRDCWSRSDRGRRSADPGQPRRLRGRCAAASSTRRSCGS